MRHTRENRFLIWLKWSIPIALTGWWSLVVWTAIQLALCHREEEKIKLHQLPLSERPDIKIMNEPKNLTEEEKRFIAGHGENFYKIGEGVYRYDRK